MMKMTVIKKGGLAALVLLVVLAVVSCQGAGGWNLTDSVVGPTWKTTFKVSFDDLQGNPLSYLDVGGNSVVIDDIAIATGTLKFTSATEGTLVYTAVGREAKSPEEYAAVLGWWNGLSNQDKSDLFDEGIVTLEGYAYYLLSIYKTYPITYSYAAGAGTINIAGVGSDSFNVDAPSGTLSIQNYGTFTLK
jgi:hypothetical protein